MTAKWEWECRFHQREWDRTEGKSEWQRKTWRGGDGNDIEEQGGEEGDDDDGCVCTPAWGQDRTRMTGKEATKKWPVKTNYG